MSTSEARRTCKTSIGLAAVLSVFAIALPCFGQSAQKLIAESIRAQGGKKALQRIRTSEWQGTVGEKGGAEAGEFTLFTESPD